MDLLNLAKVELHLHLDGSIRVSTVSELLNLDIDLVSNKMMCNKDTKSLTDYLTKFDLPISILQSSDNLTRVTVELLEDLKKENVIYAEIRFAPMLHTRCGLSYDEVVNSVIRGINKVSGIKCNLILCCMRNDIDNNNINNKKTIEIAKKYYNKGVVALDLAGDEIKYPTYLFKDLFKDVSIPLTIHAGEASDYHSIYSAIEMGACRIGHGISAVDNEDLIDMLNDKNILLEVCVQSNIDTGYCSTKINHPINRLINLVDVSINTDNRTVSNTSLTKEYEDLINLCNFSLDDIKRCNINAINHAFISEEEKRELIDIIKKN